MLFVKMGRSDASSHGHKDICYLVDNNWDDFGHQTTFDATYFDGAGTRHRVGAVRIARHGQETGRTELPAETFSELPGDYFSLGNDRDYYVNLRELPLAIRQALLLGLRDCVHDTARFHRFKADRAFRTSLLRSVSDYDVLNNFNHILDGRVRQTNVRFSYMLDPDEHERAGPVTDGLSLNFHVDPRSRPPSNVHVLIGRNGVGKTRILAGMANALTGNQATTYGLPGVFHFDVEDDGQGEERGDFLNLVIVSFSAFDRFDPLPAGVARGADRSVPFYYIGVKKRDSESGEVAIKSPEDLNQDFAAALDIISQDEDRLDRWVRAVKILESDPGIRELVADDIIGDPDGAARHRIISHVSEMSSGHKIVLLTLTRLIENVSERSLVLFDEPETHLHPPLLGSFMRAISDLMGGRNAVAIIATHSPVVLQEAPADCVWMLRSPGTGLVADRPDVETFAENVSTLTRKVFHLEVEQSGFYRLLQDASADQSFEETDEKFGGRIGSEGRALLRAFTWKET